MTNEQQEPKFQIFSLNGNEPLAAKIAEELGTTLGKSVVKQFSDGEIAINLEESVRGNDVYVIQATNRLVNDYYMELLIMIDALKRASAKSINVVLPYYGYARQDRTARPHEPITAKLVANLLQEAGATRVLTLDLHTVQVQGFFDIPVDNLFTVPLFAHYYRQQGFTGDDVVVVSPKKNGVQRARSLAEYLDCPLAIVDQVIEGEGGYVIGDVAGKKCIMIDDILNNGQLFASVAGVLKDAGATDIYACASHGLLAPSAKEKLDAAPIKSIVVTDSVVTEKANQPECYEIITASTLMAEAIQRIHDNTPVSPLFSIEKKKYR